MDIEHLKLFGLKLVRLKPRVDDRGSFTRLFCDSELKTILGKKRIKQINYSRTNLVGALRGMHYQLPPHSEIKFVQCLKGRVWDIVIDLRKGSETLFNWHSEDLGACDDKMLVIPEGFAHGFQALEPDSEVLYFHTVSHTPKSEGGVAYDDPQIGIEWPLEVTDLSIRDKYHEKLKSNFRGIKV